MIQQERAILQELTRLAAERAEAETATAEGYTARQQAAEVEYGEARQRLRDGFEAERAAAEQDYQQLHQNLTSGYELEIEGREKEYADSLQHAEARHLVEDAEGAKQEHEAAWSVTTVFEAAKHRFENEHQATQKLCAENAASVQEMQTQAVALVEEWNQDTRYEANALPWKGDDPARRLQDDVADAEELLGQLKALSLPRLFKGERLLGLFLAFYLGLMIVLAFVLRLLVYLDAVPTYASGWPRGWYWWVAGLTVATAVGCVGLRFWLTRKVRAQVASVYVPLRQALAEARALAKRLQDDAAVNHPRRLAESRQRYERDLHKVNEKITRTRAERRQRHAAEVAEIEERFPPAIATLRAQYREELSEVEEKYPLRQAEIRQRYESEAFAAQQRYTRLIAENEERHQEEWDTLAENWRGGLEEVRVAADEVVEEARDHFLDWAKADLEAWEPPARVPHGIRFGQFRIEPYQIPGAIPEDERLIDAVPDALSLPALLPFPEEGSLLLRVGSEGREQAIAALQAVMYRYLTALPPGKVRFTIIDPVGLGENFASFMHLADHDEALVTNRIWTEPHQIEQRLADLTEHMENVIQKYLRNQFRTIEEYNERAGEVAEPYRVLVAANFPAGFSEAAARRLLSIAATGAGCGVYTLISADARQPLPEGVSLKDLEQTATTLIWKDGRFQWKDADFGRFPLQLDTPPDDETAMHLLQLVGERAKAASRVEVPFEYIAPSDDRWWTGDSRQGIRVPLGRAGATKLQYLELGQGTSQHVLIAGKTGSGKSTLLHALITNLALHYSPDEVEFYLIDFKKGVEFKTYAAHELPHARVVAIESEREFGLSVLQRLDAELRSRGERFRAAGVQDLNGYRQLNPSAPVPRVLLIVDEFQEFFTEDDRIAQEVSLLLDRLVRQGRAFGLHVLLGSQTLGGAYSLARSTLGQMAVRVALQCSEADASLILSEENTAARLLARPGEAIYNDANGRVEGNNFFQVVWLPDDRREGYLNRLQELARRRQALPASPQIVFEGHTPADVARNHLLERVLGGEADTPGKALNAWLGEAVAIKDPTAATFRPQGGSNLLIIGQQEDTALALEAVALVSLAAQAPQARFFVLDGTPADASYAGYLQRIAERLPFPAPVGGVRKAAEIVAEVSAELERRLADPDAEGEPVFLLVHGLQRFRDLRRQDDDFSFSREDKAVSPAKQLEAVVREGPAVGVHVIASCDSLTNVQRALDRQALRDFDMRILFQMSVADSSTLIDSPAASKLGPHRALFHSEERGVAEKFRPYRLPPEAWLTDVKRLLAGRAARASVS